MAWLYTLNEYFPKLYKYFDSKNEFLHNIATINKKKSIQGLIMLALA